MTLLHLCLSHTGGVQKKKDCFLSLKLRYFHFDVIFIPFCLVVDAFTCNSGDVELLAFRVETVKTGNAQGRWVGLDAESCMKDCR